MSHAAEFAGQLRERIIIERAVSGRSAIGTQQSGWEQVARCLAAIKPSGAGAEREGMALSAMPRFDVTIRRRDGVAVGQRVRWSGRWLQVRQLIEDPRTPDRTLLRCEEVRG